MQEIIKKLEEMLINSKNELEAKRMEETAEFYPFELTQERVYLEGVTSGINATLEIIKGMDK